MKFHLTAVFTSLFVPHALAGAVTPRSSVAPPADAPLLPGISVPPQPYPGVTCNTNSHSPSLTSCLHALSKIPRTDAPLACTKIYKPWHVVASYGGCEIAYWSLAGNAHCQSNKEMVKYVRNVLGKCKGRRNRVEGYEAVEKDGGKGVWVYRGRKKEKGEEAE